MIFICLYFFLLQKFTLGQLINQYPYAPVISSAVQPGAPLTRLRPSVTQLQDGTWNVLNQQPVQADTAVTSSVIRTPKTLAIVDTGWPADRTKLLASLATRGLNPSMFDLAIHTHGHMDHTGNNNFFLQRTLFMAPTSVGRFNKFCFHPVLGQPPGTSFKIDDWVTVMSTPGGDSTQAISIIVDQADFYSTRDQMLYSGRIALTGDLFQGNENFNGSAWVNRFTATPQMFQTSLANVICPTGANVGFILTGHGDPFVVTDQMRQAVQCQGVSFSAPTTMSISPSVFLNPAVFNCSQILFQ